MNKLFKFLRDHMVLFTIIGCVLMILVGITLLLRPSIIVAILRYGTAAISIIVGFFMLVRTVIRAVKSRRAEHNNF